MSGVDRRIVVLLKSLRTNNRFYTLVEPNSGYKNADAIEEFPDWMPLGIAYPCLEDGLNDFAVIRTTFETIEVFPEDEELRKEMMSIIEDARGNLVRRLVELRDRIISGQAHFLGTDYQEFKNHLIHMATKGTIRRQLDSMMKVDVFESVARAEANAQGMAEPMYRYEFLPQHALANTARLEPRAFIGVLFEDVLLSVQDDANYAGKNRFDRDVFQKFIAVMFVNYATTDPLYYGTSREDYGVSADKDMSDTPLYLAVARALRYLERGEVPPPPARTGAFAGLGAPAGAEEDELAALFSAEAPDFLQPLQSAGHQVEIAFGAAERSLMQPLTRLAEAVRLLRGIDHPRSAEIARLTAEAGRQIFRSLQELQILSPLARDPIPEPSSDGARPDKGD